MVVEEKIEVQDMILASGGFADVRCGSFMGRLVAVKTARITPRDDLQRIRKVGVDVSHSGCCLNHFIPAILQGGRPLEYAVPSERHEFGWSLRGHEERTIRHRVGVDAAREYHGVHWKESYQQAGACT